MAKIHLTDYVAPSGKGTPMFSRRGQETIPMYVYFQNKKDYSDDQLDILKANKIAEGLELDQIDLSAFQKEYEEMQEK